MDLLQKLDELGQKSLYKEQGELFLKETGTMLEIVRAVPQLAPRWAKDGKHGTCYSVTIARPTREFSKPEYENIQDLANRGFIKNQIQFFFWNSIAAKEAGRNTMTGEKKPKAYNILANLYQSGCETFEDFCGNFGYSTDSREAEQTYREVLELNAKLESIYSAKELEAMGAIN